MFFEALKRVFDSFGAYIFVPIMLYIIARVMKCNRKRAFQSALFAGVGLEGFSLLIHLYPLLLLWLDPWYQAQEYTFLLLIWVGRLLQ
ncbi:hypothetical protein [Clostridium tyrobutyricum]|uniref:hypothetical protein n=1 Tax=Clostridium tyrobutyricum TaxID=1519 RepID=UPI0020CE4B25|nr:hypothetical protein [Clostridium tyrobutyricum]